MEEWHRLDGMRCHTRVGDDSAMDSEGMQGHIRGDDGPFVVVNFSSLRHADAKFNG